MIKNRTRNGRGNLIRKSEMDLESFKNDALNSEVADLAVRLHVILSIMSTKYSEDTVADLIPDITTTLTRLDAALKVNDEQVLTELSEENNLLLKSHE